MWFSRRLVASVALGMTVAQAGCSSIKSTLLERDVTNTGWTTLKTCGVPVTLKVTTHLRVTVTENRLFTTSVDGTQWTPLLDHQGCAVTERSWAHEKIQTDKVFTVDFKRPAAGIIKYNATFSDQYFTQISNEVEDKTIAEISSAIQGVLGVLPKLTGAPGQRNFADAALPQIIRFPTVVAVAVFDLDEPDWELQMTDFLAQHLSGNEGSGLGHGGAMGIPTEPGEHGGNEHELLPHPPVQGGVQPGYVPDAPAAQLPASTPRVSSRTPRLAPRAVR